MTDIYGTEPHDHEAGHDEVLTHEHDVVHEPPSDYEFADDHGAAATEEHEHADGEDHDHELGALPGEAMIAARRSPVLPIAAAVGGILLLGGVAWWQFGSSSAPVPISDVATMAPIPATPIPPAASTAPKPFDASAFNTPASTVAPKTASAASIAASAALTTAPSTAPDIAAIPAPVAPATVKAAPVIEPTPVALVAVAPLVQTAPVTVMSVSPAPVASSSPLSASAGSNEDQRIAALNARIDALQKSLEQATQQLGQVSNMVAATAMTPTASAPNSKELQDRLDKMEQQMAQLHHPAPTLAAPVALPTDMAVAPAAPYAPRAVAVARPKPVVHKTVHVARNEPKLPAPTAAAPTAKWVLRAASPGQAWVAPDAASRDLKALHVGDELAGIGRVTAIQQNNGGWVVLGTKGSIE